MTQTILRFWLPNGERPPVPAPWGDKASLTINEGGCITVTAQRPSWARAYAAAFLLGVCNKRSITTIPVQVIRDGRPEDCGSMVVGRGQPVTWVHGTAQMAISPVRPPERFSRVFSTPAVKAGGHRAGL